MLGLLSLIATPILVGVVAQKLKGRTGALWFFITAIIEAVVLLLGGAILGRWSILALTPEGQAALALFALGVLSVMFLVVWSLPER